MLEEKIYELKKDLNELMTKEEKDPKKILKISEELDLLIIEYYRVEGIAVNISSHMWLLILILRIYILLIFNSNI